VDWVHSTASQTCITSPQQTCVLPKFFQNLFFVFIFRNVADEKANIGNRYVNSESLARPNLMTIQLHSTINNDVSQSNNNSQWDIHNAVIINYRLTSALTHSAVST